MGKRIEKKDKIDSFDIEQFAHNPELSNIKKVDIKPRPMKAPLHSKTKTSAAQKNNVATKQITNLILQDIDNSGSYTDKLQKKKKVAGRRRASNPKLQSSTHIVDLRKQYLIQKYSLDTINKQEKKQFTFRFFNKLKQFYSQDEVDWHYPAEGPRSIDEKYGDESILVESMRHTWKTNLSTAAIFAILLIFILSPIPGLSLLSGAFTFKQDVWSQGVKAFSVFTGSLEDIINTDYSEADAKLGAARDEFNKLYADINELNSFILKISSIVPPLSDQVELAKGISQIGSHSSSIAQLLARNIGSLDDENNIIGALEEMRVHFSAINQEIKNNEEAILDFDAASVSGDLGQGFKFFQANLFAISNAIIEIDTILDLTISLLGGNASAEFLEPLSDIRKERAIVSHISDIISGDRSSKYLLLFQNSREIRATGGFLGSYAVLEVLDGKIVSYEIPGRGTYELGVKFDENFIPPKPISVINREWNIWDANWWPDFPTSANKISWFYEKSESELVDGVIAINSNVVIDILSEFGPVFLEDYNLEINADNFYDIIHEEVEGNFDKTLNQPKKILQDLFPLILNSITTKGNYSRVFSVISNSLARKDIQIALFNKTAQEKVSSLNWDGALKQAPRDYLYVVSSNLAGGKSDADIYETIDHEAIINNDGSVQVTVNITKEHRAEPTDQFSYQTNLDYIRLYVPKDSRLISATGFTDIPDNLYRQPYANQIEDPDIVKISGESTRDINTGVTINHELGHTVFGHWMQVEPGATKTASITYKLPFSLNLSQPDGSFIDEYISGQMLLDNYSLLVEHQSGKINTIFNSSVSLPKGMQIVWNDSLDNSKSGLANNSYEYSTTLKRDLFYAILISSD